MLTRLGRGLLIDFQDLIAAKQRIIAFPDGSLNAIPFDLLDLEQEGFHPLVERFDVLSAPSLAFFLSPKTQAAGQHLLGIGNPRYRVSPAPAVDAESGATPKDIRDVPLPETAHEVESIGMLLGEQAPPLLGPRAAESVIKRAPLRDYSILHFATHGVLSGKEIPGISEPALVLSEEPGEDGVLTATEASQLDLNARLTVLSACNTGTGDMRSGEGVLGMSRAFLLAGSQSVLVSLWSIDSLATEPLMVDFYRRLSAHNSPAHALRCAKLAARGQPFLQRVNEPVASAGTVPEAAFACGDSPAPTAGAWQGGAHPFYWSGFSLVGE